MTCIHVIEGQDTTFTTMGYDATVYLIYGVRLTNEQMIAFSKLYLERHPEIQKKMQRKYPEYLESDDGIVEYCENFIDSFDGYKVTSTEDGWFFSGWSHRHEVCRDREDPKPVKFPTKSIKTKFEAWCAEYNLGTPTFMTHVVDG